MFWPDGLTYRPIERFPRALTVNRRMSPFSATLKSTLTLMRKELAAIRAKDVVLIALEEQQFRIDGAPRAGATPEHPGIILSMTTPGGSLSFPCDTFSTWQDNLRAVVLTMERLRAIDRYGVTKSGEQYTGWKELPATATPMPQSTHEFGSVQEVLDYLADVADIPVDGHGAAALLRYAQRATHPDHGGSAADFREVSAAERYLRNAGAL